MILKTKFDHLLTDINLDRSILSISVALRVCTRDGLSYCSLAFDYWSTDPPVPIPLFTFWCSSVCWYFFCFSVSGTSAYCCRNYSRNFNQDANYYCSPACKHTPSC